MIQLTTFSKQTIMINAFYIEKIESTPDTVISLMTGKKILVLETAAEVSNKVTAYYRSLNVFERLTNQQQTVKEVRGSEHE